MGFVARRPFTHKGIKYRPGDVVKGFPEDFFRSEGFIRTGLIIEDKSLVVPEPKAKKSKPVVEVEASVVEEVAPVVEEPVAVAEEATAEVIEVETEA